MNTKYQANFECDPSPDKIEQTAETLLEEYTRKLRAGEKPDPMEFLARCPVPDKDDLKIDISLVTLLVVGAKKRAEELERLVASGQVDKAQAEVCNKLFGGGKE